MVPFEKWEDFLDVILLTGAVHSSKDMGPYSFTDCIFDRCCLWQAPSQCAIILEKTKIVPSWWQGQKALERRGTKTLGHKKQWDQSDLWCWTFFACSDFGWSPIQSWCLRECLMIRNGQTMFSVLRASSVAHRAVLYQYKTVMAIAFSSTICYDIW